MFHRYITTLVEDTKPLAIEEESLGKYKDGVSTFDWFCLFPEMLATTQIRLPCGLGQLPIEIFNKVTMALTILHTMVMMYNTDWKIWVNFGINVRYAVMFAIRVSSIGGWACFIQDVRGSAFTLQNRVRLATTIIGPCGAFLFAISQITDTFLSSQHVFKGFMVIPLSHLLVVSPEFLGIMESFAMGLHEITTLCILLFVVFYFFSFVAHNNFKDLQHF